MACRQPLPLCDLTPSLLCVHTSGVSFIRTPALLGLGPTHVTSCNLNYHPKGPNSKYSHIGDQGLIVGTATHSETDNEKKYTETCGWRDLARCKDPEGRLHLTFIEGDRQSSI